MIDFVIPWVDGSDIEWQKKKAQYDQSSVQDYNNSNMRYRDWGTLRYVLRGIEQNCPWYNKIILITEGHYPWWLNVNNPKIQLVTHNELYFDTNDLPTFSSQSIEMNLPNLSSLADKFVYMNDDTLILKYLTEERFFKNGLPVDFFGHGWLPRNAIFEKLRGMSSWSHACKNNIDLINRKFQKVNLSKKQLYHSSYSIENKMSNFIYEKIYKKPIWIEHYHQPLSYLKQTLLDVRESFPNEMELCSQSRFRGTADLNQYLYRYWQLVSGSFYPYKHKDNKYYKLENRKDMELCLSEIDNYALVCPNDSVPNTISEEDYQYMEKSLIKKLEELLPNKSSFEK